MARYNAAPGVASSKGNASARVNRVDGTETTLPEGILHPGQLTHAHGKWEVAA